jgi:hypothetical protein
MKPVSPRSIDSSADRRWSVLLSVGEQTLSVGPDNGIQRMALEIERKFLLASADWKREVV